MITTTMSKVSAEMYGVGELAGQGVRLERTWIDTEEGRIEKFEIFAIYDRGRLKAGDKIGYTFKPQELRKKCHKTGSDSPLAYKAKYLW